MTAFSSVVTGALGGGRSGCMTWSGFFRAALNRVITHDSSNSSIVLGSTLAKTRNELSWHWCSTVQRTYQYWCKKYSDTSKCLGSKMSCYRLPIWKRKCPT